ncbi:alcohol dehydrogenase catalytic domain-containing protein [Actinomadura macra]|uniref:alcohol dehydrogenase catalytic domain-containing protein n=1 Tax=Actinomadura macra TaxID=46164 RepID=UPI000830529E|nr:alcohol dehydrogenase catalytic domain-containing protein [Actinomadura macra]
MKALVFKGPATVAVEDVEAPRPGGPRDAVVRVRLSAICGSDLHVYNDHVPGLYSGMPMGHEYMGEVVTVGADVTSVRPGDDVVGSFTLACGGCAHCAAGRFNHCTSGRGYGFGPLFGDCGGTQAELVLVPDADVNLLGRPAGVSDEDALLVGDIMSTAWYACRRGRVVDGDLVLTIGAGPVGVLCAMAARAQGARRIVLADTVPDRLDRAREITGAETVLVGEEGAAAAFRAIAPSGADVVIESAGLPAALLDALTCVRDGGTVSVIGVHGEESMRMPSGDMFRRGVDLQMCGPANVQGVWREVMAAVAAGTLSPSAVISHRLRLEEAPHGYELFAARKAMKIVLDIA